ncbi:MAG: ABC transporter ATP-binding protein [Acidobacteriota bacterium]|nr:ABC transporter ATP-binding protein [Acidobacteriota bacterium]
MIRYRAFTKRYDGRTAVDSLTLEVPAGSVVALLGPNGSGKTTSIKAAAGLLRPDSGDVVLGAERLNALDPRARRACSFLPQRVSFPETLTGREVVDFYRRLREAPADAADRVLKFASLNGAGERPVGTYSGGMVQRLGLAVATLGTTDVLLLDEPTAALDPDGLCAFYGLVEARRRAGGTVFFSSHQLGDIERLADRVAVIVEGKLVAVLSERELAARLADRGVMRVRLAARVGGLLERIRERSPEAVWFGDELVVPGSASTRPAVLDLVRAAGAEIRGLTAQEGRLDAFYRELIGAES